MNCTCSAIVGASCAPAPDARNAKAIPGRCPRRLNGPFLRGSLGSPLTRQKPVCSRCALFESQCTNSALQSQTTKPSRLKAQQLPKRLCLRKTQYTAFDHYVFHITICFQTLARPGRSQDASVKCRRRARATAIPRLSSNGHYQDAATLLVGQPCHEIDPAGRRQPATHGNTHTTLPLDQPRTLALPLPIVCHLLGMGISCALRDFTNLPCHCPITHTLPSRTIFTRPLVHRLQ